MIRPLSKSRGVSKNPPGRQCYYLMFYLRYRAVLCHQTADACCPGSARRLYSEPPELRHDSKKAAAVVTRQAEQTKQSGLQIQIVQTGFSSHRGNGRAVADARLPSSSSPGFLLIVHQKVCGVKRVSSVVSELIFCALGVFTFAYLQQTLKAVGTMPLFALSLCLAA